MGSTFHGLELGKRGLFAQQTALSTTGHNIANANTAGYTRQRAEMQATNAIPQPGMQTDRSPAQLGTGVEVNKLVRLREEYLDVQLRGENKNLGYWEAKSDTLSKIEELLNEPSDTGLAFVMDEFWKGWQELSKNPDSAAARAVVKQKGIAVTETFKYITDALSQMKTDLVTVVKTKGDEIQSIADQIGKLNDQISRLVPHNYEPNDLYDQRDVLLDRLSKLVDVNVSPAANGMINVSIGGKELIAGKTVNSFSVYNPVTGEVTPPQINNADINLVSGELFGRLEAYNKVIPDIETKINKLAEVFKDSVNTVHKSGFDLDGNPGVDFFSGTNATNLNVNAVIMTSLNAIAAAKKDSDGAFSTGNGKNAQDIAAIKFNNSLDFNGTKSTADDFYRNIIGQLGIDSQESQRMYDNSQIIINQVENRRQSVSGVSIDEEMANMIKFQQAYNAAARVVTVMDQCLEKIINGMGRVGL
ncbi:flagellar hook-associated protein FlgK [Neobacillus citreus]|uniref:Flagellar hook-associated protein 1 n=1 Tax=Neobacillus citreus TaxID=2833578 RepID=A0A942SUF3_9BACI|nr:flagellar hook-associated protein FlgK [Neobacillus citreus]MCH6266834.1 flagellar hook-associated protein FlgK [Neobacillus citreus]